MEWQSSVWQIQWLIQLNGNQFNQPTNPNVSLQMQHRVWMPQNPTFQEWISSPSDPVSVANSLKKGKLTKHLTSKTKSLIQKLAFKGFKHIFFQKKNISKPSRTFPLKKTNLAKRASITQSIPRKKKRQNLQENTSRNVNAKVFWLFFEDIRLVNSLGAKSRAANAQAKRAKSCMDFMWQLQLVRLMPKENTTYYEFMRYSLVV